MSKNLVVFPCALFFSVAAAANPVLVDAPVAHLFQPAGFDDNDNVEVILHGTFPSSCYKIGPVSVSMGLRKNEILLDARAYRYNDSNCMQMRVPFIIPVSLGTLSGGEYTVRVVNAPGRPHARLHIANASVSAPDDFMYASIDAVSVREESNGKVKRVTLTGTHPVLFNGCLDIKDVKVSEQQDNTVVLQPITVALSPSECRERKVKRRFNRTVELPSALGAGAYLFHVRTLNSVAINHLEIVP